MFLKIAVIPVWALTSCSGHKSRKTKEQKIIKQSFLLIVSLRRFRMRFNNDNNINNNNNNNIDNGFIQYLH